MAIYFEQRTRTFYLESKDTSYVFFINAYGLLQHLYYGKRIAREDLLYTVFRADRGHGCYLPGSDRTASMDECGCECPVFGRSDFRESMVDFRFADGCVCDLTYEKHELLSVKPPLDGMPSVRGKETLAVTLKDRLHGATVTLYYTVFEDLPVILRHAEIVNEGKEAFMVERAYSFCTDMPDKKFEAITLPGAHVREREKERTPLAHGVFSVMSKRGVSSGQMNPFLAIVRKNTDETGGEAYGFNLVYSGDFAFKAEISQSETLRIVGGINDYGFYKTLARGEKFVTPEVVSVYSDGGLGKMSRAFHDLYREYLICPKYVYMPRPIVLNSWEAAYFDFDKQKLCDIIDGAANTGIDTFVLDDGWFGVRDGDKAGLGDWVVNTKKLPGGLRPVIDHAHEKGMKFGLWFEPEMVNKDSDLYRAHPDWIVRMNSLEPCPGRDQYVLDLSKKEVRRYIIDSVSKILRENEISYVKWDMNRPLSEGKFHHDYVLGLYEICEAIVCGFPDILFEGCASGGCRFDPAMLYYFPQIWTSDNSDAYARTRIQYGTSLCYPLSAMSCHVSVSPNHQTGRITPFATRAAIAHLGATGYELNPALFSATEKTEIVAQIADYKDMQDLVLTGDLYRLNDPMEENLFAVMLVGKDKKKAHVTAMRPINVANGGAIRVFLQGLDADVTYTIAELSLTRKGGTLMHTGILIDFPHGDFSVRTLHILKS